jgi:hypothetical protein
MAVSNSSVDLVLSQLRDLISGLALGCALVTALYTTNAFLGYLQCDWRALLATNTKFFPRLLPGSTLIRVSYSGYILFFCGSSTAISLIHMRTTAAN